MIPRYSRKPMAEIWSDDKKFSFWLEIELLVCEACAHHGLLEPDVARRIRKSARFDTLRVHALEAETKHDVLAFLASVGESLGADSAYLHRGLTSSDVIDTAFSLQLVAAADIVLDDLKGLCGVLEKQAWRYKDVLCMGRSHGMWAEPMSFGLKMAYAYAEFQRHEARLRAAREEVRVCALSGPVGTYAHLAPEIEAFVADRLQLRVETISTQIIPRDRHGMFFCVLGLISASVERLATEVRHLQRSEVAEAAEPFATGQKGSSAMPHKRNPILSENVSGLGRLVRAYVPAALDNVVLWHERDISHSSVERVIAPDATMAVDFALHRLTYIMDGLVVEPDTMAQHIEESGGLYGSSKVLVALMEQGVPREQAYNAVQKAALDSYHGTTDSFLQSLQDNPTVNTAIKPQQLQAMLQPQDYIKHLETIYKRVFNEKTKTVNLK